MTRRMHERCEPAIGSLAVMRDIRMEAHGAAIDVRLFDSMAARGPGPVLVYYHGGGFVVGDLDTHAPLCAEIARQTGLPVVAVDYRLAPEHAWPAAPEDAEAAARWIAGSPEALGLDVAGLVLAGDSAGGTLTIVTALALVDSPAAVPVRAIWPIYPAVSPGTRFRSFDRYGENHMLDRESLAWFYGHYAADVRNWRATPIRRSLAGLPPTLVLTAQCDPLVDQGRAFAEQCEAAGVRTVYRDAAGQIHGFLTLRKSMPSGEAELSACTDILKELLAS